MRSLAREDFGWAAVVALLLGELLKCLPQGALQVLL